LKQILVVRLQLRRPALSGSARFGHHLQRRRRRVTRRCSQDTVRINARPKYKIGEKSDGRQQSQ
jgi:hypothetical protein